MNLKNKLLVDFAGFELTESDKIGLIKLCDKEILNKYKIDYRLYDIEPDQNNDVNFKIMRTYDIDHTPFVEAIKEHGFMEDLQELSDMGHTITADDIDRYLDREGEKITDLDGDGWLLWEVLTFAVKNSLELSNSAIYHAEIDHNYKDEYEDELQLYYDFIKSKKLEIVDKFIIPDLAKIIVDFLYP